MNARIKKLIVLVIIAVIVFALYQFAAYRCGTPVPEFSYCQEYIPGGENMKGTVDPEEWAAFGPEFEIGANRQGYAVFKDPRAAMDKVCRDYKIGIWHLKRYNFAWLVPFRLCYKPFVCYDVEIGARGWKEAAFVSRFVDIYENSFEGDLEEDLRDEVEEIDMESDEENQQ